MCIFCGTIFAVPSILVTFQGSCGLKYFQDAFLESQFLFRGKKRLGFAEKISVSQSLEFTTCNDTLVIVLFVKFECRAVKYYIYDHISD